MELGALMLTGAIVSEPALVLRLLDSSVGPRKSEGLGRNDGYEWGMILPVARVGSCRLLNIVIPTEALALSRKGRPRNLAAAYRRMPR